MSKAEQDIGREFVEPRLRARIEDQQEKDGIDLAAIPEGGRVTFETQNTVYEIEKADGRIWLLTGGKRWSDANAKTRVYIVGSTFGGSVLKADWLGEGMNVEICEEVSQKVVTTSPVVNLWQPQEDELAFVPWKGIAIMSTVFAVGYLVLWMGWLNWFPNLFK